MNIFTLACVALVFSTPSAQANLVTNGDFEQPGTLTASPGYLYLSNNSNSVTGWTSIDDGVGELSYLMNKNRANGTYVARVYEGTYALALNQGASLQTAIPLVAGVKYDLSFYARANVISASALQVSIAGFNTSFANTTNFANFQHQFTAASTDPSAILKFYNPSTTGGNRLWSLDAISVVATIVPLPTAAWSFLTGLIGFLAVAKQKKIIV